MDVSPPNRLAVCYSPAKRVRAEIALETVWIGSTVYPDCPVWRVWYDDRPMIDTSPVGLTTADGPLAYGMMFLGAARHRPQTGAEPARSLDARFASRDGRELDMTVSITDKSASCAVRQPRKRRQTGRDLSVTCFQEGSTPLGDSGTRCTGSEAPQVRFTSGGKLIAFWRHEREQHAVFFDRPGELAESRLGVLEHSAPFEIMDGRQGCSHLFLTLPFLKTAPSAPVFGESVTPAFRAAFQMIAKHGDACDAFRLMRGEPGEFAMAARRQGGAWQIGGVTAEAQTLTVRFEDLWLRTPPALRTLNYTVTLLRDPIKGEPENPVRESFTDQAPDVRIALDLAANGGFLLTFEPTLI